MQKKIVQLRLTKKIYIDENIINLNFNNTNGLISLETDYFYINSDFNYYYLEESAFAQDTVILETNDERVLYFGLNFKTNTFNYIVVIEKSYYYSSVKFDLFECLIDLNDSNVKDSLMQNGNFTYENDNIKFKNLEVMARNGFLCFETSNVVPKNNSRSIISNYTLTAKKESAADIETEMNLFINDGDISPSLFVTPGFHYGYCYNLNGLDHIYLVETGYDEFGEQYYSSVKIWEIIWSPRTGSELSQQKIQMKIISDIDIFITGDENSGTFTAVSSGSTYMLIKSLSFNFTPSNLSYISKYQIGYGFGRNAESPAYLASVEYLLAKAVPYYEKVTGFVGGVIDGVTTIVDYVSQVNFDEKMSEFNIANGEKTARTVGFEVLESELGASYHLYDCTFNQFITVNNIPINRINSCVQIEIIPVGHDDLTFKYIWEQSIKFESECTHQLNYASEDDNTHNVTCGLCNYSFTECHDKSYENCGDSGHLVECSKCNYSNTKEHNLIIVANGNSCSDCSYFIETTKWYVSNRDGMTHTVRSGTLTKKEACLGTSEIGSSEFRCIRCNQVISNRFPLNDTDNEEIVMYIENITLNKKDEEQFD